MTITAGASPDEFTTSTSFTYPRSGKTVTRAGRAVIYTGFQWRGRSTVGGDDATSLREVMMVDRDWRTMSGRWFTGGYDEMGVDIQLTRVSREPVVLGLDRRVDQSLELGAGRPAVRRELPRQPQRERHRFRTRRERHARREQHADACHDRRDGRRGRTAGRTRSRASRASSRARRSRSTVRSTSSRSRRAGTWRASAASSFRR